MSINNCLILSAGFGTRMKSIGKDIPKVLWPVFEKKIIDLQIAYAKEIGAKRIYINSHHHHGKLESHLNNTHSDNVILIYEKRLLNVGGAIHNVALRRELKDEKELLIINGDQFLFFEKKLLEHAKGGLKDYHAILFGIKVPPKSGYNELVISNDLLIDIRDADNTSDYITYSGVSLINLRRLKIQKGPSYFFKTVAKFDVDRVKVMSLGKHEYWDFGSLDRYYKSIYQLFQKYLSQKQTRKQTSKFFKFCLANNVFDEKKVNAKQKSYDWPQEGNVLNFSQKKIVGKSWAQKKSEGIILEKSNDEIIAYKGPGVYYNLLFEEYDEKSFDIK